jgi:predicted DNA-binding transcriptional regulator YafY
VTEAQIARLKRRLAAAEMWQSGMSVRVIAEVLGVSERTVYSDLAAVDAWRPVFVTGRDGKTYPVGGKAKESDQVKQEPEPEAPIVLRCAYCNWATVASRESAASVFAAHVCSRPAPPKVSARGRRSRGGYRIGGGR